MHQGAQGERIAIAAETHDLSDARRSGQALVADFFAGVRVAQVNLNGRYHISYGLQRIAQAEAGMG